MRMWRRTDFASRLLLRWDNKARRYDEVTAIWWLSRGIAAYLQDAAASYDYTVTTQDWHIDPGEHFSDQPDFRDSWPTHCVADT